MYDLGSKFNTCWHARIPDVSYMCVMLGSNYLAIQTGMQIG